MVTLLFAVAITSCAGSDTKNQDNLDLSQSPDLAQDVTQSPDEVESSDTPRADQGQSNDETSGDVVEAVEELLIPPGEGELGEPCAQDGDCKSTLCWSSQRGSGCTMKCETNAECQAVGLVCLFIREGVKACAPVNGQIASVCTHSAQCPYPTLCVPEFSWCDLPECTFDAECPQNQRCNPGFRRCEPIQCVSTVQCVNPLEFCHDGQCGPPLCTNRAQCDAGEICHKVQGECQDALACDAEGKCSYYNSVCVDGLCEPNLCTNPCSHAGDQCNPSTGQCGPPCSTPGGCPAGWGCDQETGICFINHAPVAVAMVQKGSTLLPAANLPLGSKALLDGSLSVDPEQKPLQFVWTLDDAPPGTALQIGGPLGGEALVEFTPPAKGLYHVSLRVQDETGVPSAQSQVALWVQ